jgi:hypothetical protein
MRAFCWISSAKVCLKGLQKPLSFIFPPNRVLGPAFWGNPKNKSQLYQTLAVATVTVTKALQDCDVRGADRV